MSEEFVSLNYYIFIIVQIALSNSNMNVCFRYPSFSRHKAKIPYFLDTNEPDRIKPSRINPAGPFYFISHGYLESGDKLWVCC